jgi:hypothetical protein
MAVPRPLLFALVGAVLLAVTFTATRGARDNAGDRGSAPTASHTKGTATPKKESAAAKKEAAPTRQPHPPNHVRKAPAAAKGPTAVRRAIASHRRLVIFFYDRRAYDDRATASAVAALRSHGGPVVVSDRVGNLRRYGSLLGSLDISRTPAVVVVDGKRRARVIEGFIDPESLRQDVSDVR